MISPPLELSICSESCSPYQPPLLNTSLTLQSMSMSHNKLPQLSPCTGLEPIKGSYLPSNPLDTIYPPEPLITSLGQPVNGHYKFVPESCQWTHSGRRFMDPSVCRDQKKKALLLGDSHWRVAYDSLVHRLAGRQDTLKLSVSALINSASA